MKAISKCLIVITMMLFSPTSCTDMLEYSDCELRIVDFEERRDIIPSRSSGLRTYN
jgi:hypothetical protein